MPRSPPARNNTKPSNSTTNTSKQPLQPPVDLVSLANPSTVSVLAPPRQASISTEPNNDGRKCNNRHRSVGLAG
jgi:hypothetical protein